MSRMKVLEEMVEDLIFRYLLSHHGNVLKDKTNNTVVHLSKCLYPSRPITGQVSVSYSPHFLSRTSKSPGRATSVRGVEGRNRRENDRHPSNGVCAR